MLVYSARGQNPKLELTYVLVDEEREGTKGMVNLTHNRLLSITPPKNNRCSGETINYVA